MPRMRNRAVCLLIVLPAAATQACTGSPAADDAAPVAAVSTAIAAAPAQTPAGSVRVDGAVAHPRTLSVDQLRDFPARTQAVQFESSAGTQTHTYDGAALTDILGDAALRVSSSAKNPELTVAVLATGTDGYSAAVSWGELSPAFGATPVLVAYTEDGRPLDTPRLVVPGDVKGGRYVSGLTDLRVVDLRTP